MQIGCELPLQNQLWRIARHSERELLLHLLAPSEFATHPLALRHMSQSPAEVGWRHFRLGNLIGIGFGAKETEGSVTGDLAVRAYVKRKIPREKLSARNRIPECVNGVITDVIAIGTPRFQTRPVSFGAGIGHSRGELGSLGCLVRKPGDDARYVLSACHVLALAGAARVGDVIVEPARPDESAAPFATLIDFEPLKADGTANNFDAAIALLIQKTDVRSAIPLIGIPQRRPMKPVLFQSVRKYGAGTGETLGVVAAVGSSVTLELGTGSYLFEDVVQVLGAGGRFSTGGDSGALVVDALTRRPIGLIIGGEGDRTFVSPIGIVLKRFGVQLA